MAGAKKKLVKNSLFYACYILVSKAVDQNLLRRPIYIGSTPDVIRRFRQHNGEIAGGAKKTAIHRPWEMVLVVYGFPSKFAALQFEWAWQNPHKSRHFKVVEGESDFTGRPKERFLATKLKVLGSMFRLEHYKRWPLHLHFNSNAVLDLFNADKSIDIPSHVGITTGSLSTIPTYMESKETAVKQVGDSACCAICEQQVEIESVRKWLTCSEPTCPMIAHILCLSRHFLANEAEILIPLQGVCPFCNLDIKWGDLVKAMDPPSKWPDYSRLHFF